LAWVSSQAEIVAALVSGLAAGVDSFVVCPGSRSSPIVLAIEACAAPAEVVLDERSATFRAMGRAVAAGRPVAVVTTSGTAVAELLPGVVEASQSMVPLVLVTANRPARLQRTGANQTIIQEGIFGPYVRGQFEVGGDVSREYAAYVGSVAAAMAAGVGARPGPVHVDVKLDEPLLEAPAGRSTPPPAVFATPARLKEATARHRSFRRPLLWLSGRARVPSEVIGPLAAQGWVVLADALTPRGQRAAGLVSSHQALLQLGGAGALPVADLVVLTGDPPFARGATLYLRRVRQEGGTVLRLDRFFPPRDPHLAASGYAALDEEEALHVLAEAARAEEGWQGVWERLEEAVVGTLSSFLEANPAHGAQAVPALLSWAREGDWMVLGSSLPVRWYEAFSAGRFGLPWSWANRGASGIDGTCSTAIGLSSYLGPDCRVACYMGDLAFLHDLSGLVRLAGASPAPVAFVVYDNGGGGIFDTLEHGRILEEAVLARYFRTPPLHALEKVAESLVDEAVVTDPEGLAEVLPAVVSGPSVILVRGSSAADAAALRALSDEIGRLSLD
jgi:2-succinyl-5-enolpyruvyl-6-hydroxy-3-cyclohexene-1-carboxylate synthase